MTSRDVYIGLRIVDARILRNVSADDLAANINIPASAIERIERGEAPASAEILARIATYLNVPLSYFFEGFDASK